MVGDLNSPDALMAKHTLDFVLGEIPYTRDDFVLDYESLPQEVYNYVVTRAGRKFQNDAVSSEVLYQFTADDEVRAKRMLIRKKLIPKAIKAEVEEELSELLSFAARVPNSIKDNLALLMLQGLIFADPN